MPHCTICDLTCIAIYSTPPRFTRNTRSALHVTRVVFTINGTRRVTLATVETSIITTCINEKINYTEHRELFVGTC